MRRYREGGYCLSIQARFTVAPSRNRSPLFLRFPVPFRFAQSEPPHLLSCDLPCASRIPRVCLCRLGTGALRLFGRLQFLGDVVDAERETLSCSSSHLLAP